MIDVEKVVPVDYEARLLGGEYRTLSKGRVDIEGSGLSAGWGIDHNGSNFIESIPIALEAVAVDLLVD